MTRLPRATFRRATLAAASAVTLSVSDTSFIQAQQPPPSPPPGVSVQGEPTDGQTVTVGSYRLVAPREFTVTQLPMERFSSSGLTSRPTLRHGMHLGLPLPNNSRQ